MVVSELLDAHIKRAHSSTENCGEEKPELWHQKFKMRFLDDNEKDLLKQRRKRMGKKKGRKKTKMPTKPAPEPPLTPCCNLKIGTVSRWTSN